MSEATESKKKPRRKMYYKIVINNDLGLFFARDDCEMELVDRHLVVTSDGTVLFGCAPGGWRICENTSLPQPPKDDALCDTTLVVTADGSTACYNREVCKLEIERGYLVAMADGAVIASYAPGEWLCFYHDTFAPPPERKRESFGSDSLVDAPSRFDPEKIARPYCVTINHYHLRGEAEEKGQPTAVALKVYREAYAPAGGAVLFAIYGPTAEDGGPIHDKPAYRVVSLDMPPGAPPVYDGLTIAEARQRILALTGAYNDDRLRGLAEEEGQPTAVAPKVYRVELPGGGFFIYPGRATIRQRAGFLIIEYDGHIVAQFAPDCWDSYREA